MKLLEVLVAAVVFQLTAGGQNRPLERAETAGHLVNPASAAWSPDVVQQLRVPEGFAIEVFAARLGNTRMIAVSPSGGVYVTRRNTHDVILLRDTDGDGVSDNMRVVARQLPWVNGIHISGGQVYLATDRAVYSAPLEPEGELLQLRAIVENLPDAGQHPNRTVATGPDGMLYVTVGSTCNACQETNPMSATIQRFTTDGGSKSTFAEGLRNTIGFDWHPGSRRMWAMDMGSDWRGDDTPPDELNLVETNPEGTARHYGWPWCYADRQIDRHIAQGPPGQTREEFCARTVPSYSTYVAHSSPISFVFPRSTAWPEGYRNSAFITFRGSWNREPPSGYKVVRLRFEGEEPAGFEDFITGWLSTDGTTQYGRIAGLAFWNDGSMLVADDENGVIYRVSPK